MFHKCDRDVCNTYSKSFTHKNVWRIKQYQPLFLNQSQKSKFQRVLYVFEKIILSAYYIRHGHICETFHTNQKFHNSRSLSQGMPHIVGFYTCPWGRLKVDFLGNGPFFSSQVTFFVDFDRFSIGLADSALGLARKADLKFDLGQVGQARPRG